MTTDLPVLYSFRRCPFAMRARMALRVAGAQVDVVEVSLADKPAALRLASPKATVPVLVLTDGTVIDESLDIMRWALAVSDPEDWLGAVDDVLVGRCDGGFKRDLDGYKYGRGGDAARDGGVDFLGALEARLGAVRGLCRDDRGYADIAIMPFVRQFAAVDRGWFAALPLPGVQRWLAALETCDLFTAIMRKPSRAAHSPAP